MYAAIQPLTFPADGLGDAGWRGLCRCCGHEFGGLEVHAGGEVSVALAPGARPGPECLTNNLGEQSPAPGKPRM